MFFEIKVLVGTVVSSETQRLLPNSFKLLAAFKSLESEDQASQLLETASFHRLFPIWLFAYSRLAGENISCFESLLSGKIWTLFYRASLVRSSPPWMFSPLINSKKTAWGPSLHLQNPSSLPYSISWKHVTGSTHTQQGRITAKYALQGAGIIFEFCFP